MTKSDLSEKEGILKGLIFGPENMKKMLARWKLESIVDQGEMAYSKNKDKG
jgi:hypothetical protein